MHRETRSASSKTLPPASCVLFVSILFGCDHPPPVPVVHPDFEEISADNIIFNMRTTITREGVKAGLLTADTAYHVRDSAVVHLRGLRLITYEEGSGRMKAEVTAQRGRMNTTTNEMEARGEVLLTIPDENMEIESSEMFYDPNRDRVWSNSFFISRQAGGRVSCGTAFESQLDFESIRTEGSRTVGCPDKLPEQE